MFTQSAYRSQGTSSHVSEGNHRQASERPNSRPGSRPGSRKENAAKNGRNTSRTLGPDKEGFKVAKRHHGQRLRRPASSHDSSMSLSENASPQLSEDDLLQLLIGRIRQREKREMNSATVHEQMEAKIVALEQDNKNMKDNLEFSAAELQKKKSEIKNCRTQVDLWKAKLSNFKQFLNEFGKDYQILRDEADYLKTEKISLHTEKQSITAAIDDLRKQTSAISQADYDRRQQYRAEVESICNSYKESSKSSERQLGLTNKQLAEEKLRVAQLEAFIQHNSRAQSRQLTQIQDSQHEVMDKIQSSSELVEHTRDSSQNMVQAMTNRVTHELLSMLNNLRAELTTNKLDAQQIVDKFALLSSR